MSDLTLRTETRQTQSQTLTPRLQHAVRLLQLSSLDYLRELHEAASRNPFLDAEDDAPADGAAPAEQPWTPDSPLASLAALSGTPDEAAPHVDDPAARDDDAAVCGSALADGGDAGWEQDAWQDSWHVAGSGARGGGEDGDVPTAAAEMMAAPVELREHLHGQARVLPLSPRDRALVAALIESLDDDGYLRVALDEVAAAAGLSPRASDRETSTALKLVQSFDPAGVGARDLGECLRLQMGQIGDEACRALAGAIVGEHLERLAQHDLAGLARRLGRTLPEVAAACAAIRRLDPRPGWRHGRAEVQYITPDVVVRKYRGRWTAQLNAAVVPRVRLNQAYAQLFRQHREARHGELAAHLQEARWTVRNVEQRFSTILAVSRAILRRQYRFLEYGAFAMKPLGLREIAEEVGLHESTVCRVTNNKYMATPGGVFELKYFFSRAMPTAGGGACSAVAIRGVIEEMIAAEDPRHPLSDVEIAARLARQGLAVARRTVTKYRQMLKLPPVEHRRADRMEAG